MPDPQSEFTPDQLKRFTDLKNQYDPDQTAESLTDEEKSKLNSLKQNLKPDEASIQLNQIPENTAESSSENITGLTALLNAIQTKDLENNQLTKPEIEEILLEFGHYWQDIHDKLMLDRIASRGFENTKDGRIGKVTVTLSRNSGLLKIVYTVTGQEKGKITISFQQTPNTNILTSDISQGIKTDVNLYNTGKFTFFRGKVQFGKEYSAKGVDINRLKPKEVDLARRIINQYLKP